MQKIHSRSRAETKKIARIFAASIGVLPRGKGALVVAMDGELGSGKTAFTQDFAHALGVRERVTSPSFVVMKIYPLPRRKGSGFRRLVHIDCYRLAKPHELRALGFADMCKDAENIIAIEWAARIKKILPAHAFHLVFSTGTHPDERIIHVDDALRMPPLVNSAPMR
ncbi:MAG: tRNA (adenosine(37)-N6)-threonylcarbamoyltransferase complex ATPase subunit type 1 TsaE [bacterium]|nr:tRNA (adenosine(37)-N6)-threonylcarbamoyltransferase complex ATPase subunit type 1 TsaE [bacterium]MDZ4299826.1 tRNA (adenosine(37)-N6)-threonylcarbamoyltransferase complex ATPase subunit type 1 TsaE [Candidatus Sungbacteria bacterium]